MKSNLSIFSCYFWFLAPYKAKIIKVYSCVKFLEENIEVNLHNLGLGKAILDTTPKAQGTKEKIDKMNSSKLKTLVLKRHKENEKITQRMG